MGLDVGLGVGAVAVGLVVGAVAVGLGVGAVAVLLVVTLGVTEGLGV